MINKKGEEKRGKETQSCANLQAMTARRRKNRSEWSSWEWRKKIDLNSFERSKKILSAEWVPLIRTPYKGRKEWDISFQFQEHFFSIDSVQSIQVKWPLEKDTEKLEYRAGRKDCHYKSIEEKCESNNEMSGVTNKEVFWLIGIVFNEILGLKEIFLRPKMTFHIARVNISKLMSARALRNFNLNPLKQFR